mmetsp:Transcript_74282/g.162507  ORF Transcript_74282/g.162507 Transcript_74282/m.162507 type:complete len:93 (-) Transcript_74282:1140-1418(-)
MVTLWMHRRFTTIDWWIVNKQENDDFIEHDVRQTYTWDHMKNDQAATTRPFPSCLREPKAEQPPCCLRVVLSMMVLVLVLLLLLLPPRPPRP